MSNAWSKTAMFDPGPLKHRAEQLANGGNLMTLMSDLGLQHRYLFRERLAWWVIDRYCIALGCHPLELYPDFYQDVA